MRKALFALPALVAIVAVPALAGSYSQSGYLSGTDDYDQFTLYANSNYIELTFHWPTEADFWVTVYGQTGDLLGDFCLAEGEIIQLSGGGTFTIVVTSEYGGGEWWCEWVD